MSKNRRGGPGVCNVPREHKNCTLHFRTGNRCQAAQQSLPIYTAVVTAVWQYWKAFLMHPAPWPGPTTTIPKSYGH